MNTINISNKKMQEIKPIILSKNIFNTEGSVYDFFYRGNNKVLKILYNTDGISFANKLYTVEMLDFYKESLPSSFVLPDNLVSIGGKISGFTIPKFNGMNFADLLNDKNVNPKEKIYYLTKIGETLNQLKSIREFGSLDKIFINDLHESNIMVNPSRKELVFIDLDSCKILNNGSFPSRYLGPSFFTEDKPNKYKINTNGNGYGYIVANENSDLFCYNIMVLNYLFGAKITRLSIDDYYDYLNYLEKLKFNKHLIDSFNKLTLTCDNINPVNYLNSITEEQVARAKKLVYDKVTL